MEYINKFTSFLNDIFLYSNEEPDNLTFENQNLIDSEPLNENENDENDDNENENNLSDDQYKQNKK